MEKHREILRLHSQGLSGRSIAASCGCSRNTVAKVLEQADKLGIAHSDGMSERELEAALFGEMSPMGQYHQPDYEHIHREMAKSGVTLRLLWNEYCEDCRLAGTVPYMYTQFCLHYREWAGRTKATMHIHHKPGEKMEVDWAGQTMRLRNNLDGADVPVSIFVAVLPCSGYAYVS